MEQILTFTNKQGVEAFQQGKYYEAIAIWHEALKIADADNTIINTADYASILFNKARAYEKLGCLYLAQKGYDEVLKKEPHHTKAKEYLKTNEKLLENFKLETIRNSVQQFITLEGQSNDEIKISILKEIEQIEYGTLVRQFAYKKTADEVKNLVVILKDLGYLTTKLGELSGELKYYTEAAVFYQYIITMLDEKLNEKLISIENKSEFIKQEKLYPHQQLTDIQQLIFSAIGGDKEKMPVVMEEAASNKLLLSKLRLRADLNMEMIEKNYRKQAKTDNQQEKQKYQELYVNAARKYFEDTADEMKEFLAKLYSDSEQEMAIAPPCKYAVIGLGSMALKQMTPYSDLEFAILTDNEDYQQSDDPKVREYFKNLSHLVNFKVINLGESIIPTSRYGLDMSHLVHVAVNFDLGGKTPLGRIDQDKKYDLVQTVDGMMGYVRNEQHWASHIDKNLPHILEKVCYVYGDEQIVQNYQNNIMEFLNKNVDDSQDKLNCQIRALKLLEEGTVEIDYLSQTSSFKSKEISFKGDLDKFQPNLDDAKGRLFDVKQEIYRLPDRMVYNLGLYYGIVGDSSWDTVDKLASKGVISVEAASNLKNAITFATTLRLKTYLHHQAQIEDMSIFAKPAENESTIKEQAKQIFHLPEDDLQEDGGLFQYFYTALPLHNRLQDFCNQYEKLDETSKQQFFQQDNFYENNLGNQGLVHYRLLQYKAAQSKLEEALKTPLSQNNFLKHLSLMNMLGNAYDVMGQYDQAIEKFQESLKIKKLIYKDEPHPAIADSLNNLGNAYQAKGQYDQAIEKFQESLKIKKLIYKDEPHPAIAASLNNLGIAYQAKGQYDQAIEKYQESLKIKKLIYKDEPHPAIAASLNNLGNAYQAKGQYDQVIEKYQESLEMRKLIYKDEPHPAIADSLYNLGHACYNKGQYDQAMEKFQESLEIRKLIYKDEPHPDIAASLNNLGSAYQAKGQYDLAIKYSIQALQTISIFHDYPYEENIKNNLRKLVGQFNLNSQKIIDSILSFIQQGLDFTDYQLHYAIASLSQDNKDTSIQNIEEIIEEYKLALIFFPKEQSEEQLQIKQTIFARLAELTREEQKNIELWLAIAENNVTEIQKLADSGVELNYASFMNTIPLIQAITTGNVAIVSALLSGNIDINKPNNDQASPLYCSLGYLGQPVNMAIVKLLLDNGANVNQPMYDGDTPMHMAHYKGNKEAIGLLLQYRANINTQNAEDKTPLHCLLHSKDVNLETKFTIIKSFHDKYDMTIQDKDDSIVIGMLFMLAGNPFATEVNVDNSDTDVHVSTLGNNDDL